MSKPKTAIKPTRHENYPAWYQEVIKAADLAENAAVRGCMTIKPWGYAIWENIQRFLDSKFKATGHANAYFPLLIPLSFLEQEAKHVEGFAKECAVVTHHRLIQEGDKLIPASKLEEPLVIRPTSEAIIGTHFAKWIESHRDLPLKINQWANIMRWEMRTRMFLRTSEFLWQEGHTAHATVEEAMAETRLMLDIYADFATDFLAMPVIKGEKTQGERFPGAVNTFAIEAMMQDRKALQAGTSHFLGQNFSKSFNINFSDEQGNLKHVYTTSWGVSTRLIGGLIMTHSDDDGLVLPPRIAPTHVVIIPILRKDADKQKILAYCQKIAKHAGHERYAGDPIKVAIDDRDIPSSEKNWQYIKQGVPIRLEIGGKEVENNSVFMGRRDKTPKEKLAMPQAEFFKALPHILEEIQAILLSRAVHYRDAHTHSIKSYDDFVSFFTPKNKDNPEIHGGFAIADCTDTPEVDKKCKTLKVSARCIPLDNKQPDSQCIFTGKQATCRVVFAKAY